LNSSDLASVGARGLLRTADAVDSLINQIRYELKTSILPQRSDLMAALSLGKTLRCQIDAYVYDEILPLRDYESATTNFAALALDMAQLEDALVDLRRAISWSAKYSGFNWWIRHRQRELGIQDYIVIPGPGSAREFLIERESSVAKCFDSLSSVIVVNETNRSAIDKIRILTVPQLDGAASKWFPISLGHELAHLKYDLSWLEERLCGMTATTTPSREAKKIAQARVREGSDLEPAVQSWYAQLRSWLMETACDSALYCFYGDEGLRALTAYLTLHSDSEDGPEHPSPRLRLAALTASDKNKLGKFKEPAGTSPAGRERKEAYIHFASQVRDEVLKDLQGAEHDQGLSNSVRLSASGSLDIGTPPNSLDWPDNSVVQNPTMIEAGLVRSLWPTTEQGVTRDDVEDLTGREHRVDFAVDFLQFSHRFEIGRQRVEAAGAVIPHHGEYLPNVLFLSGRGVATMSGDSDGASSMDLRLGRHFIVFKRNKISTLNSLDAVDESEQIRDMVEIGWGDVFVLHPGEMVLAATLESIVLDLTCNAQVLSRSSLGRMGLLSATAVHVQPGFRGTLTLELVNLASVPLRLNPGQRIAQIVPSLVCGQPEPYHGKYQNQDWRPKFSAIAGDWELPLLKSLSEDW